MVVLAAINAIFITQATVLDAQRPSALARALGATPRQVSAGRGCPRPRCWPRSSQERGRVLSGS
jgi:hypothetical protein